MTQKGQATIPKPIRDLLGIKVGSQVDFIPVADGIHLVNCDAARQSGKNKQPSRFAALRGSATVRMSTEEIMALTRGEA
ncbi:MAG: AbrB/MazE/SpoVT family DNA-binding domain-containing protein [Rhodocyclaceae bacterium]|nr:AbrB/MazE/SpoVT family DNA-binding domain-containing protein [Rhodocyclaceae bacterium]